MLKIKKILLIDDIISTGRTIAQAVGALKHLGASSISAAATHGIFAPGSIELLEHSDIQNITVTNTIAQIREAKINVVDISPLIQKTIRD